MARYIDADKIEGFLRDSCNSESMAYAFVEFMAWIDDMPTDDVREVVHGKWKLINSWENYETYKCTNCNNIIRVEKTMRQPFFCDNCGSDMDTPEKMWMLFPEPTEKG